MSDVLTHGELFAGISGFGLGFARAGIKTLWHVEIDKNCQKVLRHHYPGALLLDDVTECGAHNLPSVDVISFGTPCQDLSIAGKREGLKGERSGLFFEGIRIVDELKPTFAVWENVPGAFSSNAGRDFAAVLSAFRECGACDIAWRVLDAQYFGVAQRRRRVFIVADFRGERTGEILFEPSRCAWNPAESRKTGQGVARTVAPSLAASGREVSRTGESRGQDPVIIAPTLTAPDPNALPRDGKRQDGSRTDRIPIVFEPCYMRNGRGAPGEIVPPLKAQSAKTGKGDGAPVVFQPRYYTRDNKTGGAPDATADITNAHKAGDSAPVIAYGFSQESDGSTVRNAGNIARPVTGRHGDPGVVAFDWQAGGSGNDTSFRGKSRTYITRKGDYAQIRKNAHDAIAGSFGVRRLMPIECERLQGFPDNWTNVDDMSDGARYRMLGNAVAVPVAEWIGRRIAELDTEQTSC